MKRAGMIWNSGQPIRSFDLFAGVGGFRLAAQRFFNRRGMAHECVGWSEIDRYCQQTYRANFATDGEFFVDDIQMCTLLPEEGGLVELSPPNPDRVCRISEALPDFDILFAGFPCQSFSLMGNKRGLRDPRGTLFFDIREILRAKQPAFFVLENVRGLLNVDHGRTFQAILTTLREDLGYHVSHWLLNSADYGVPQIRRRVFIAGVRRDIPPPAHFDQPPARWPRERFVAQTVRPLLAKEVDDRYWLSNRLLKTILSDGTGGFSYRSEIDQDLARPLCRTMHKMHRAHQDNYYSERYIHGWTNGRRGQVRRLTPTEAFLLQGFDGRFVDQARDEGLSDTRLYMGAGNAVTVTTVEAVLGKLFRNKSDNG